MPRDAGSTPAAQPHQPAKQEYRARHSGEKDPANILGLFRRQHQLIFRDRFGRDALKQLPLTVASQFTAELAKL